MRRKRGLRIPIFHQPDPVLELDELDFIADQCARVCNEVGQMIDDAEGQSNRMPSESDHRRRIYAESVLEKIMPVIRSMRRY